MLKTKDGYAKVIGTSYQGSSDYLLLSNGDSKAISSLSVNYANDADKLDGYHENSFLRYRGDASTDQEATLWSQIGIKKYTGALPDGLTDVYNYGSVISLPGDSSRFEIYASHQSSSGNGLYYRSGWGNDKKPWLKFIDSSNIGSQSVNYANSAGNADTVDGQHALDFASAGHNHDGRYVRYYTVTTLDCNNLAVGLTAAKVSATNTAHTNHSAYLYISDVGTPFQIQIPDSSVPYIYKRYYGSGGWSGWFKLNAGYADSAGSVAWNNVTGRPSTFAPSAHTHKWADITDHITKLSQLTNDKGFVTGSVSGNTITINGSSTTWSDTWRPITDDYELGESGTSLSSLGSLTLYNDLLGAIPTIPTIPNPTDYYWANNKVSNKSTTEAKVQLKAIGVGCAASIDNSIIATNWIRAKGSTGIYFQDHGGGLYMSDDTWIRTWAGKALQVDNTIRSTDFHTTYYANNVWTITSAARLENSTTLIYGFSTSSNNINTYLRGTNITLQVKNGTSINYNAFQVTADETRCFNYFNMKGGATVSNGNLTVQNNAYLAQKAGTKVGIGTSSPQSTLDIKGSGVAPLRVNGSIELCHDNTYLVQPLILAYGAYYGSQLGVSCSTPITVMSYTDQIVINFINIKKSSFTNNNFAFYMTPLDSSANISTYVRFNETSGPIVSVHIKNPVKLHQFSFILYVYQSKLKTYTIDFLS